MNLDKKEFSANFKKILKKPFSPGLHLAFSFPNKPLSVSGSFDSSIPSISQSILLKNSQSFFDLSLGSNKFYKASLFFTPQTQASICLYSRLKADFDGNLFTNNFEILYQDPAFKCSLGVMNRYIGIYMKTAINKYNFAVYGATLHDFSNYKARVLAWTTGENYEVGVCKEINGGFEGNFCYRSSEFKEVAGKIKTDLQKVQILLGILAKSQDQTLRVRLDSEGTIGFELTNKLQSWISLSAATEISVKQIAKEGKTFMGFGLKLNLHKDLATP